MDQNGAHTRINICTTMRDRIRLHGAFSRLQNDDGQAYKAPGKSIIRLFVGLRLQQPLAFPAAFVVAARSFGVAAPAFYCLGEFSSFFSLSTAISFNHVDLLFRLIKFAHSAAKQRARS